MTWCDGVIKIASGAFCCLPLMVISRRLLYDICPSLHYQRPVTKEPTPQIPHLASLAAAKCKGAAAASHFIVCGPPPHVLCSLSVLYLTFTAQYLIIAALCYLQAHKTHTPPRQCVHALDMRLLRALPRAPTTPQVYQPARPYHPQFYMCLCFRWTVYWGWFLRPRQGADFLLASGKRSASVWLIPPCIFALLFYFHLFVYEKSTHISHGFQIQFGANFYLTLSTGKSKIQQKTTHIKYIAKIWTVLL